MSRTADATGDGAVSPLARDPAKAAAKARETLAADPRNRPALRLLAAALRWLGDDREAEQAEREAIRLSLADPLIDQASRALTADRPQQTEEILRHYLHRDPNDPVALVMLAELAFRAALFGQSEGFLRRALAIAPSYDSASFALARILLRQDRLREAVALLDQLLGANPRDPMLLGMKASALDQLGDYEHSIALIEQILQDQPDNAAIWVSYGNRLRTVGRLDEAVAAYRHALGLDAGAGEAWWGLANIKTARLGEEDRRAIAAALGHSNEDVERSAQLHLAYGKALEDAQLYAESFHHYAEGNRLRRTTVDYDPASVTEEVQRAKALFTPEFFAARSNQGAPSPDPIFILGMPRSGSTLIEQILASHSMVEGTSELPHIPALVRRILGTQEKSEDASYPEALAALDPERLRALGEDYLSRAQAHRKTDRPYFTDKLPHNWSDIGLILLILPNARIIDARREPLACCWSNFKQYFSKGHPASFSLEEMGLFYADYVRMMAHHDAVLPGRIHRVFHENLVEDPEAEIRSLLEHCNLPFERSCLEFHENARAVRTVSSEQVRQPLNRSGIGAWRPYEPWLAPLKKALGPVLTCYPEVPTGL